MGDKQGEGMPSDRGYQCFYRRRLPLPSLLSVWPLGQFTHGGPSFPVKPGCLALGCGVEDLDSLAFGRNEAANVKIPG
jgi:hypothetical protein